MRSKLALVSPGYDVILHGNAQAALQAAALHENGIHLLVTDVVMPGLSSPELISRVAKLHLPSKCSTCAATPTKPSLNTA